MTPLVLAVMIGVSGGLLIWALRGVLRRRWDRDLVRLEHTIWRLTPEPFNAKPWVAAYYATVVAGIVACFFLPYKIIESREQLSEIPRVHRHSRVYSRPTAIILSREVLQGEA